MYGIRLDGKQVYHIVYKSQMIQTRLDYIIDI
jgi:hypothetical protein